MAIFLGLLLVRGRIDRAAILMAGVAELIFLSDPWVYWVPLPVTFIATAWWATAGNSAAIAAVQIAPRSDRTIAPGAQGDIDRCFARDYEVVASADVWGDGFATVSTYILLSDRTTYAVATDRGRHRSSHGLCARSPLGVLPIDAAGFLGLPLPNSKRIGGDEGPGSGSKLGRAHSLAKSSLLVDFRAGGGPL